METVTQCQLCPATEFELHLKQTDLLQPKDQWFTLQRCTNCELIFLNPRPAPDELMQFYAPGYVAYHQPLHAERTIKQADRRYGLYKRVKYIEQFALDRGQLLDVGCATGAFLEELDRHPDWTGHGVEPNPAASQTAREATNAQIITGMLVEAAYPDDFFDVVTMWDVLEHVYEPKETLKEIRRILKPNGFVVFSLPNLDSWDARLFGAYWAGYDAPRHMHVFGQKTLAELLKQTGFIEMERACIAGSHFYFFSSVMFYLQANYPNAFITRFVDSMHRNIVFRMLLHPYFLLANFLVKSSNITVACRIDTHFDVTSETVRGRDGV